MNGRPPTIPEALESTAARGEGEYVFHLEAGPVRLSCAELAERAERQARRLLALGVEPGDAVGVLGPNRPEWVVSAFAVWFAGAALVPVQVPLRVRDPSAFSDQLRSLVEAGGCRRVLADPALVGLLDPDVGVDWGERGEGTDEALPAPTADSAAVIQFTSGSTSMPKGSLLTHAVVAAQIDVLRGVYVSADAPREIVNWTPFFHDLGLFHNLVQTAFIGNRIHQLPTERFAADPAEWLRLVEATRSTMTVAPSSAFGAAIRAVARRGERLDLGSLEVTYFAAEGVDPEVADRLLEVGPEFGLRPETLGATYGLAEAGTVAYPRAGSGLRVDRISVSDLAMSNAAEPAAEDGRSRWIASSGEPLMDVRIVAADGGALSDRELGEIEVRGPSVMSGYVGPGAAQPFRDGWLRTGDLGYLVDGELYVAGRSKDLIVVMGHNYYPEDFEWAASRVEGARPGRCVAFSVPETDDVVTLVESKEPDPEGRLAREVARATADAVGIRPAEVVVLPPGTVQKTTSGKLRRAAMRELFLRRELEEPVA